MKKARSNFEFTFLSYYEKILSHLGRFLLSSTLDQSWTFLPIHRDVECIGNGLPGTAYCKGVTTWKKG